MADVPDTAEAVIGASLRGFRAERDLTQHEATRLLRQHGLGWSRATLQSVETGNRRLRIADGVLLAAAYGVAFSRLFSGDGQVELGRGDRHVMLSREAVRAVIDNGYHDELLSLDSETQAATGAEANADPSLFEADSALASKISVETSKVLAVARRLWGRSLTEERERRLERLGPNLSFQQKVVERRELTRDLSEQLVGMIGEADR